MEVFLSSILVKKILILLPSCIESMTCSEIYVTKMVSVLLLMLLLQLNTHGKMVFMNLWYLWYLLTHSLPMHPFFTPENIRKSYGFLVFWGVEKGCIGKELRLNDSPQTNDFDSDIQGLIDLRKRFPYNPLIGYININSLKGKVMPLSKILLNAPLYIYFA